MGYSPKSAAVRIAQYEDMKRIAKKDTIIVIANALDCTIEEIGYKATIRENIKIQREKANMSLEQLSNRTGYDIDIIKQYEEDIKIPKYTAICCIAALLDVSPLRLYGVENEESQDEERILKLQLEISKMEENVRKKEKEMQGKIDEDEKIILKLKNENTELKNLLKNISKQIISQIKE